MAEETRNRREGLVVAVVLTWNDTEMTLRCVESVLASDYPALHVLLVDNGSERPCGREVKEKCDSIELLTLPQNQGFSGGANRGFERALERGADYIHLIGNDSTLYPDTVSKLVAALEENPDAGLAGPLLLFPDQKTVQFYTASLDRHAARHVHDFVGMPLESRDWGVIESEFIPCVAPMFRARALGEVGLFDEIFGTSWEDYDLCIRLRDAGWKYITVGNARAVHLASATVGHMSPYSVYYYTRNRFICLFRHGRKRQILRRSVVILRSFWQQVKNYGLLNWACHVAFIKGLLHYFFSIRGEKGAPKPPAVRSTSNVPRAMREER